MPFTLSPPAAVLLGAWTYLLSDSCPHPHGWFVARLPLLSARFAGLPVFRWLQFLSTLLGLVVLYRLFALEAPRRGKPLRWAWSRRAAGWAAGLATTSAFTARTLTAAWNHGLSANDQRRFFFALFSEMRDLALVDMLAALLATKRPRSAPGT